MEPGVLPCHQGPFFGALPAARVDLQPIDLDR